jgi:hypothetical protein
VRSALETRDEEQATADAFAALFAFGFACFVAGALFTVAVAWVIARFL